MTDRPGRREALGTLAGWLLGAGLLPLTACAGGPPVPKDALVVDPRLVPSGTVSRIRFRETPVLLVNLGGPIRALSGLCTHEGCELGWNPRQRLIRCPCHGSAFTPDGAVTNGPAQRPLPSYPVEARRGRLIVTGIGT